MTWQIPTFGVRHLSPMGAWQLRAFLEQARPSLVLVEGLDDATGLLADVTRREAEPPLAILAYTDSQPVRTLVYPFARYSPEYQAIAWAHANDVPVEFFDLPSDIFLGLQEREIGRLERARREARETKEEPPAPVGVPEPRPSLYNRIADLAGERDYDTYWERHFEHNADPGSYRGSALELGRALRELEEDEPLWRAENLVREAYMRRRVGEAIASGHAPDRIVAVVGAFHAPVLNGELPAMTDRELASLPRRASKLTLMPYSYFRLSSQSGYGAGNHAPAYFELLWQSLEEEAAGVGDLSRRYLSLVARHLRDAGTHRSTAEVIDAVRLAETLSALKNGLAPTLADLRDAAVTLLGQGEPVAVREALARVDVGTAIGRLPKGVSQTSIQADFDRELARLKLEKYRSAVQQELDLDLRENRRVKAEDAAFLDLNRSSFFHRLRVLGISFARPAPTRQQSATWAEKWALQWTPESEIQLVEAVLLGETVELATAYKFKSNLEACMSIAEAAAMVRDACQCGLMKSMDLARRRLQQLAATSHDFAALAAADWNLGLVVRYGDVRRFDPTPLLPLLEELFVEAALSLFSAASCDDKAVKPMMVAIDEVNKVGLEFHDRVEEPLWIEQLRRLSDADDRNPSLSGFACAILLERGLIENDALAREVSRRLSPGVPADLGAGWFEGLARRNRYALLARQALWEQLAGYVESLDEEQFRRALVFLRRAFGPFSPREKRHIAENLGELWGLNADVASEMIEQPLTEAEEESLKDLNEFDFDL
ncbi:hypothetical protein OJF2_46220 [Aquisphaera giovannonii]|uniref:Uncharacterized protein n=1 Tax=Aquisphaera giovannonii TaxID=406548 RepID=A0A5B9W735_9BACT|nr:DUF5682 family protein [Aquisphaera giovannonii]QEH36064.1 hypothetical protein OJF2_46220 [Aquisphaera giovannonii]